MSECGFSSSTVSENRKSRDKIKNADGDELLRFCGVHELDILNGRHGRDKDGNVTYISKNGDSVIDYALACQKSLQWLNDFWIEPRIESHHMPICITLKTSTKNSVLPLIRYEEYEKRACFKWIEAKEATYRLGIERNLENVRNDILEKLEKGNYNSAAESIENLLQKAGKSMKRNYSNKQKRREEVSWFTPNCREAKLLVDRTLKLFHWLGGEELREEYTTLRKIYIEILHNAKREWQERETVRIQNIISQNNSRDIWGTIRKLRHHQNRANNINPGEWEVYFSHLLTQSVQCNGENNWEQDDIAVNDLDHEISIGEITLAIKNLKGNKSCGPDGIPPEFYKSINDLLSPVLVIVFNYIYTNGVFPRSWCTGLIYPIYKNKGEVNDPSNYRGISLLNIIVKIFCKILYNRLYRWVEREDKLSPLQAGFRNNCSTVDNIFIINSLAERATSTKRGKLFCAFVDFEKAFDTVDRNLLWQTLREKGISTKFIRILQAIYTHDTARVMLNTGCLTNPFPVNQGVKQGCVLSPLLFILFIDELPYQLEVANINPPRIGIDNIPIPALLFADDLVILSESQKGLQKGLEELELFCDKKILKVNTRKTKTMVFKNGWVSARNEEWTYKNVALENVKEYIYLGMNICMNRKWCRHINRAKLKGIVILNEIKRLKLKIPDIPPQLTDKMFKGLLIPSIAYGAEIWGAGNTSVFNTLQVQYLKSVIGVSGSSANNGTLWEFGLRPLETTFKIRAMKYWRLIKTKRKNNIVVECFLSSLEGTWCKQIKGVLEKLDLGYLWQAAPTASDLKTIIQKIKANSELEVSIGRLEKQSLLVQTVVAGRWGRKPYINSLNSRERGGYGWFRLGGWKLRKLRDELDSLCPFCNEHEDWIHILLVCPHTDKNRNFLELGGFHNTKNFELALRIMRDNRMSVVQSLGRFLSYVREKREDALSRMKDNVPN